MLHLAGNWDLKELSNLLRDTWPASDSVRMYVSIGPIPYLLDRLNCLVKIPQSKISVMMCLKISSCHDCSLSCPCVSSFQHRSKDSWGYSPSQVEKRCRKKSVLLFIPRWIYLDQSLLCRWGTCICRCSCVYTCSSMLCTCMERPHG